ncbi:MAG: hypothetical protein D3923_08870 [Candidatus Electrothrix sp. AR3]|nr:hypothetical protein [Candidatus Electrothrix sp. AR3]
MVELTGGEPLLQKMVYPLMRHLLADERDVLLETGGSINIIQVPTQVGVILDLKCPGSGMLNNNQWANLDLLKKRKKRGSCDEVKFVLSSEQDVAWAMGIVRKYRLTDLVPVLFSPVVDRLPLQRLAELILREKLPIRLQLQLHTRIWPDVSRGV